MNLSPHNAALARYLDDWLADQHRAGKLDAEHVNAHAEFSVADWSIALEVRITNGTAGYVATAQSKPSRLKRTRKNLRDKRAAEICVELVGEAFGELEEKV